MRTPRPSQDLFAATVTATPQQFGQIDVVGGNAGTSAIGTVATTPLDALARVLQVRLIGVIRTLAATLPHGSSAPGCYLLSASGATFTAMPDLAACCASNNGIEQFGDARRHELEPSGVSALPTFDATPRLRWPFRTVGSVRVCAEARADAVARRSVPALQRDGPSNGHSSGVNRAARARQPRR
jgi:NAD(P)-dependent dehydrogenase (short-subunit alcohol dehydrogenase family)